MHRPSTRLARVAAPLTAALLAVPSLNPAAAVTIANESLRATHDKLATQPAFSGVGRISAENVNGFSSASGVYLGNGWVLTAAHVVDDAVGLTFNTAAGRHRARGWTWHGDWNPDRLSDGNDLALIQLETPIGSRRVQAAPLYRGDREFGELTSTVGFGRSGNGTTGFTDDSPLTKRFANNRVDRLYGRDILLTDFDSGLSTDSRMGDRDPGRYEGAVAPGDSGGGLFVHTGSRAGGGWSLAGITSFGYSYDGRTDSDFGDWSGYTRVGSFLDWIEGTIRGGNLGMGQASALETGHGSGAGTGSASLDTAAALRAVVDLEGAGSARARSAARSLRRRSLFGGGTLSTLEVTGGTPITTVTGGTGLAASAPLDVEAYQVPEPAGAAALSIAGLALLSRRRGPHTPR